jgi:hypothetical protein
MMSSQACKKEVVSRLAGLSPTLDTVIEVTTNVLATSNAADEAMRHELLCIIRNTLASPEARLPAVKRVVFTEEQVSSLLAMLREVSNPR